MKVEKKEKIPLADWIDKHMEARSYQIGTFEALCHKRTEEAKQRAIRAEEKVLEVVNEFPVKPITDTG